MTAHTLTSTRANRSAPMTDTTEIAEPTSAPIITSPRASVSYSSGARTSKIMTVTITTSIYLSAGMVILKQGMPRPNEETTHRVNSTINKSKRNALNTMSAGIISHNSASASVTIEKCDSLFHIISQIGTTFMFFCLC